MAGSMYDDVKSLIEKRGQAVRFRYFNETFNTGSYDSDSVLTQSGTDLWVSGFPQSLATTQGSDDSVLLQQGKILTNDLKLYVQGEIDTETIFKLQIGSPTGENYSMIEAGVDAPLLNGSPMYRKIFLRRLTTGSLFGEA